MNTPTKSPMQDAIYAILRQHHLVETFESSADFHLRVDNPPCMPLVIERHGDEVSVAHYFIQNGDAMRDPELTLRLPDWTPSNITQDPVGHYACVDDLPEGSPKRARLLADLTAFAHTWARNIEAQGFTRKEVSVTSLTHQAVLDRQAQKALHNAPAPDDHLESLYEDQFVSDYEDYEPSPYEARIRKNNGGATLFPR